MPPKKTGTPKAKVAAAGPQHASYQDMVKEAIVNLKERNGSSRQAIKKYIQANNNLGSTSDASFTNHISKALKSGEENGVFERPKGASGPVKLKKPAAKVAAPAKPAAAATKPKTAEKKAAAPKKTTATAKKVAAPKKATGRPKKTAAAAAAAAPKAKAAASKPKANASKPRAAPAVVEKPAVVLGKTKSGRVTKSTAPQAKPAAKKAAAKKATPKKKAATPKKATPKKA
ncbi:hypothetical protein E2P81_ATG07034 [Venturia nashicola]|uniref:Histone H1 n=1 Tax=Venturia nashicola TaxID=86259 RepID=A0A4Z1NHE8_9PEZI|nr:hypothetical protein E6O75_ATG07199 [Venturia nashicola]TLD19417.1 hypothetical protein E2P81_ATG07034 [Venturia nashicola]